jgi:hypothetical protein
MTIDEQIQTALAANAPLVVLIAQRFFCGTAPQSVVDSGSPFVVWQESSSEPITAKGSGGFGGEAEFITVNFASWAATQTAARAIRTAVIAALAAGFLNSALLASSGPVYQDPQTLRYNAVCVMRAFHRAAA